MLFRDRRASTSLAATAGAKHLAALLAAPGSRLIDVYLYLNDFGPTGAALLAAALPAASVKFLNLCGNGFDAAAAAHVAAVLPRWAAGVALDMNCNAVGDAGAVALAAALPHSPLQTLCAGHVFFLGERPACPESGP